MRSDVNGTFIPKLKIKIELTIFLDVWIFRSMRELAVSGTKLKPGLSNLCTMRLRTIRYRNPVFPMRMKDKEREASNTSSIFEFVTQ